MFVTRGAIDGEIWVLAEVSPEAMAALPRLLLDERPRVVIATDEASLAALHAASAPTPFVWSPEARGELLAGLERWSSAAP